MTNIKATHNRQWNFFLKLRTWRISTNRPWHKSMCVLSIFFLVKLTIIEFDFGVIFSIRFYLFEFLQSPMTCLSFKIMLLLCIRRWTLFLQIDGRFNLDLPLTKLSLQIVRYYFLMISHRETVWAVWNECTRWHFSIIIESLICCFHRIYPSTNFLLIAVGEKQWRNSYQRFAGSSFRTCEFTIQLTWF